MHTVALLLVLSACGDKPADEDSGPDLTWRPCRTWCEDRADVYGQLTATAAGAADGSLPGWSAGAYDADAYAASCTDAPEDDRCETCSGWFFDTYLQPAGISAACDFVYRPGPAQAAALSESELAERTAECEDQCAAYGLDP